MKKYFILALLSLMACNGYAASAVGLWKTIDDISNEPKSVISITESPATHELSGKLIKLFKDAERLCTECSGAYHNKPMLGLVIMKNVKPTKDSEFWENGTILDPKTGKTYHCSLRVIEDGKKLQVRGYIGIPLFGRSQTWERVQD